MRSSLLLNLLPHTSPLLVQLQTKGAVGAAGVGAEVVGGVASPGGMNTLAGGGGATPIKKAEKATPDGHEGSVQ